MKYMKETIYGMQCVIAPSYKKRVKTSRCKLLDWIYKKVYGYVEESMIESDVPILFGNKIVFKDKETFNRLKEEFQSMVQTSSDYISKSALLEEFFKDTPQGCGVVGIKYVDDLIKNQPTIDEKEIIRNTIERIIERLEEAKRNETTSSFAYPFENKLTDEGIGYLRAIKICKEEGGIE